EGVVVEEEINARQPPLPFGPQLLGDLRRDLVEVVGEHAVDVVDVLPGRKLVHLGERAERFPAKVGDILPLDLNVLPAAKASEVAADKRVEVVLQRVIVVIDEAGNVPAPPEAGEG